MERLRIGLGQVLVTGAALLRDLRHEPVLVDLFDAMCRVAVFAIRKFLFGFLSRQIMDAGGILFIDSLMAGGAGRGNIFIVDGRLFRFMVLDEVRVMAIRADGHGQQTFFN